MSTIAVTGATGFVGGTVAAVLADKGHDVVCLVRRDPGGDFPWPTRLVDMQDIDSLAARARRLRCGRPPGDLQRLRRHVRRPEARLGRLRRADPPGGRRGQRDRRPGSGYVSTDWVFDGTGHLVDEEEPPEPGQPLRLPQGRVRAGRARAGQSGLRGPGRRGAGAAPDPGLRPARAGLRLRLLRPRAGRRAACRRAVHGLGGPAHQLVATPIVSPEIGALLGLAVDRGSSTASCTSPAPPPSPGASWPGRPARSSGSTPAVWTSGRRPTRRGSRRRSLTTPAWPRPRRWPGSVPPPSPSRHSCAPCGPSWRPAPRRRSRRGQPWTRLISKL